MNKIIKRGKNILKYLFDSINNFDIILLILNYIIIYSQKRDKNN